MWDAGLCIMFLVASHVSSSNFLVTILFRAQTQRDSLTNISKGHSAGALKVCEADAQGSPGSWEILVPPL